MARRRRPRAEPRPRDCEYVGVFRSRAYLRKSLRRLFFHTRRGFLSRLRPSKTNREHQCTQVRPSTIVAVDPGESGAVPATVSRMDGVRPARPSTIPVELPIFRQPTGMGRTVEPARHRSCQRPLPNGSPPTSQETCLRAPRDPDQDAVPRSGFSHCQQPPGLEACGVPASRFRRAGSSLS